eukprot:scaffold158967_cov49-Tisochrysis_lutea.AAC.2
MNEGRYLWEGVRCWWSLVPGRVPGRLYTKMGGWGEKLLNLLKLKLHFLRGPAIAMVERTTSYY